MTSSRKSDRLLQAACLGLFGILATAGCGGSSSGNVKKDSGTPDTSGTVSPGDGGGAETGGAALTVTPGSVDLGGVDVGTTSAPKTVTVSNIGTKVSGTLTVTPTGSGISATGCTGTLAPAATCTLTITATPAVAGPISGSIAVSEGSSAPKLVYVSGVATPPGQFSLSPGALDLGTVAAGSKATNTVLMTNIGNSGLTGIIFTASGTGFSVDTATTTCTDTLGVGKNCNIGVTFTAAAGATAAKPTGTLTVSQGGVTKPVSLSATVLAPQAPPKLAINPLSAALTAAVGSTSATVPFYVTNTGDVASGIPSVTLTGANAADFSIASSTCVTALAGGSAAACQINVAFSPKAASATSEVAVLTVKDGTASSVTASLTGTAITPSSLAITGGPGLGTVIVGATGTAVSFTVTNSGDSNSGVVTVGASDAGRFPISANTCVGKDLKKGDACTFAVQFQPASGDSGVVTGTLTATGAASGIPAVLNVNGTAVPPAKLTATPTALEFGKVPLNEETPAQTLTITNVGGAPTGTLAVTNTGAQFSIKGDTCTGATLAATKTCTITVTFSPTTTSNDVTGTITVSDGQGATAAATEHGMGIAHPDVEMDPQQVCPQYREDDKLCIPSEDHAALSQDYSRFLDRVVGQTSPEMTFTVWNYTDPNQAPDSGTLTFTISGAAASDFAIVKNNCTAAPLVSTAQYTSCVLTMTFTPSAAGLRNALFVMNTSRGGVAQTTLEAKGLPAIEIQPLQLSKTATGLDFGNVALGHNDPVKDSLPYRIWIRSTTQTDNNTTVTVTLPTGNPADFVWPATDVTFNISTGVDDLLTPPIGLVADDIGGSGINPCSNKTLSLALNADGTPKAGTSQSGYKYDSASGYWYCDFPVEFYPESARGALSAALTGTGTGEGTSSLTLTGNATGPLVITPSPALLATPVAVGLGSSTTLTLTITNQSASVTESGLSFALSGTGSGDFQIVGTDCWGQGDETHHAYSDLDKLGPGDACYVWIGFEPKSQNPYSVTFTVTAANGSGTADDETATDTIQATGSKTFGALTITPSEGLFANTAFNNKGTPLTFTIKNNGTLDSGPATLSLGETALGDTDNFTIVSPIGVAGACSITGTWTVPGGGSCTVQVQPTPTAAPNGVNTLLVSGVYLQAQADPGGTVRVPLTYYETGSLMVDGVSSEAYTFAPAGVGTSPTQSKSFVVSNVSAVAVTLGTLTNPSPFTIDQSTTGLTPAECTSGMVLAAGGQCSLVVNNPNSAPGVIGVPTPITAKVVDSAQAANYATVLLSATTLAQSKLVTYGISGNTAFNPINLGTVPFATGQGGTVTLWFQNTGGVATQPLHYKWQTGGFGGTVDTADPEFILTSLYPENPQACLSGTSAGGQAVPPMGFCSVTVYFKPNTADTTILTARARNIIVLDVTTAPTVYLTAGAVAQQGVFVQEIGSVNNEGFFQFTQKTPSTATTTTCTTVADCPTGQYVCTGGGLCQQVETHTFQVTNATAGNATINLSTTPVAGFTISSPASLSAPCGTGSGLTLAASGTCQFVVTYEPTGTTPVFPSASFTLIAGTGFPATSGTILGVMGRTQQPVTLLVKQANTAPTCTDATVPATSQGCVDFSTVAFGGTTTQSLTVINMGDVALKTGDALVTGETAATPASSVTFTDDGGCTGKVLQPYDWAGTGSGTDRCVTVVTATGGSVLALRTSPAVPGAKALFQVGTTTATTGAATAQYVLGVDVRKAAALTTTAVTPATNTFPNTAVTGYIDQTFTIVNGNNATDFQKSGVVTVGITGTNADQFQLVGTTCPPNIGLASGSGCQATVRFAPTKLSTDGNAFTASLTATATPGSAPAITILGMPKSALSITPHSGTDAAPTYTIPVSLTAAKTFEVDLDSTAIPTAALQTSITAGSPFMLIDDECYGQVLSDSNSSCNITVKYIGAGTAAATPATTTLTVNGGSAGQSVAIALSYTGAAPSQH